MGSAEVENTGELEVTNEYGKNLKILPPNDQIKELQTILRDRFVLQILIFTVYTYVFLLQKY